MRLHSLILSVVVGVFGATSAVAQTMPTTSPFIRGLMIGTGYGLLGGTALGVASLAFTEVPADNFRNIAIGASVGLYAGLAFGTYLGIKASQQEESLMNPEEDDYSSRGFPQTVDLPRTERQRLQKPKPLDDPRLASAGWVFRF